MKRPILKSKILRRAAMILTALSALVVLAERNLSSVLLNMAYARASAAAVSYMNEAVREVMGGGLCYGDLITVRTDGDGRVTLLESNALRMNELAIRIALRAQERLESAEAQRVEVPIGSAFGTPFLAGVGPRITVSVVPVGAVTAAFTTAFESAGINQTRHKILISLHATVRLVIPTGARQVEMDSEVLVAESIIVGLVPDSYIEVPDVESTLNFMP